MRRWLVLATAGALLVVSQTAVAGPIQRAYLPVVPGIPAPSPTPCVARSEQMLVNPGFEDGLTAWRAVRGLPSASQAHARAGGRAVALGRAGRLTDELVQAVTLPDWTDRAWITWWWRTTEPGRSRRSEYLSVDAAVGQTGLGAAVMSRYAAHDEWVGSAMPLPDAARYRGQPLTIRLQARVDPGAPTTWHVDDVRLLVQCGAAPAPDP